MLRGAKQGNRNYTRSKSQIIAKSSVNKPVQILDLFLIRQNYNSLYAPASHQLIDLFLNGLGQKPGSQIPFLASFTELPTQKLPNKLAYLLANKLTERVIVAKQSLVKDYATNKMLPKFVSKKQAKQAFAVMNWDDHKSDPNVEFDKWFKESAFWKRPNY